MSQKTAFLVFCFLLASSLSVMAEVRITIASLKWEPYIGPDLKNEGYVGELIRNAFIIRGYNPEIVYLPWARAVMMTKTGCFDAYGPEYFCEDLKKDFLFSRSFPSDSVGFFKMKDSSIRYSSLEDLRNYTIGVVRGYVNTAEFDSASYLKKEEATDDKMNFRKLVAGRVDLIVCDRKVGEFIIHQHFRERSGDIEFMNPPLEKNKNLYLCVSRKNPAASKIIDDFNEGIRLVLEKESFEEMMKKNGIIYKSEGQ